MDNLSQFPLAIIAILIALTVHEWAHAMVAKRLGDDTAESMGRLTLNPLAHIDPVGAILFLLVGFGWAKPVPVDARNFRHPVRDNAIVAVAGPLSNVVMAFIAGFLLVHVPGLDTSSSAGFTMLRLLLQISVSINLALFAFNLLPIAPLDGSNIVRMFVPWRLRDRYEETMQYGPWILLGMLLIESFLHVPIISAWVDGISRAMLSLFWLIFG